MMVVVLIVVAPAIWVWGTTLWDRVTLGTLQSDLRSAARLATTEIRQDRFDADEFARNRRMRVRILGTDVDADHEGDARWYHPMSAPFFGPEGRPDPSLADDGRGALATRVEVIAALTTGTGSQCFRSERGDLLTCAEARRVDEDAVAPRVVHLQRSIALSTRSLYEQRFQIAQLTGVALVLALALTLWLGTRWIRPLESLRDQALDRTRGRLSLAPLDAPGSDEFGDVGRAFNTLLSAIRTATDNNERFAADLAHELKNPLAAIRMASEALDPGRPLTPTRAARLQRILDDATSQMGTVVEGFLELARAEAGLHDGIRQPTDLAELVDNLLESVRADVRFEHVTFSREGSVGEIQIVAERMETALRNLIVNAATFAAPEGWVRVELSVDSEGVVITVADSGPGIDPADLESIFERYFSRRQGGTGLGLPLARAIFDAHGGSLVADNAPGGGAVFRGVLAG